MRRVFVSSAMGGFQAYRQAARQAITLVGLVRIDEAYPFRPYLRYHGVGLNLGGSHEAA